MAAGVEPSDTVCEEADIAARGFVGLKRPGEETGVLLAVLCGDCVECGGRMLRI